MLRYFRSQLDMAMGKLDAYEPTVRHVEETNMPADANWVARLEARVQGCEALLVPIHAFVNLLIDEELARQEQ